MAVGAGKGNRTLVSIQLGSPRSNLMFLAEPDHSPPRTCWICGQRDSVGRLLLCSQFLRLLTLTPRVVESSFCLRPAANRLSNSLHNAVFWLSIGGESCLIAFIKSWQKGRRKDLFPHVCLQSTTATAESVSCNCRKSSPPPSLSRSHWSLTSVIATQRHHPGRPSQKVEKPAGVLSGGKHGFLGRCAAIASVYGPCP